MSTDTDTQRRSQQTYCADRRATSRADASINARLDYSDGWIYGVVEDICFGGARFVTKKMAPQVPIDETVELSLTTHVFSAEMIWTGRIVRREAFIIDGRSEALMYAVRFDDPTPRAAGKRKGSARSSTAIESRSGAGESSGSILPPSRRGR